MLNKTTLIKTSLLFLTITFLSSAASRENSGCECIFFDKTQIEEYDFNVLYRDLNKCSMVLKGLKLNLNIESTSFYKGVKEKMLNSADEVVKKDLIEKIENLQDDYISRKKRLPYKVTAQPALFIKRTDRKTKAQGIVTAALFLSGGAKFIIGCLNRDTESITSSLLSGDGAKAIWPRVLMVSGGGSLVASIPIGISAGVRKKELLTRQNSFIKEMEEHLKTKADSLQNETKDVKIILPPEKM